MKRRGYLLPTWARKICQRFDWMLQLLSGQKWKKCKQTLIFIVTHYWGYTSLEVRDQWGYCSSLPASLSQWSSNQRLPVLHLVEVLLWGCHLDVLGLLHQQLLPSAEITLVLSQWIWWWFSHACSTTADFSIVPLLQASRCSFSLVSSLFGLLDVDLAATTIYHIRLLTKR